METQERLKLIVSTLPHKPGVYQYFNKDGTIIYVGKAKDLRKRVTSYFNKNHDYHKVRILVSQIHNIEHIVVATEEDALLLENNLIKKYQPRYNVRLKDDKSYPWIRVTNEAFPRVFKTRSVVKDGSKYYGPYTSLPMVRALLDMMKQLYKLRTCRLSLSDESIAAGKHKLCLEYHIKNCKAPCEALQTRQEYETQIEEIHRILKGNTKLVIGHLRERMGQLADDFLFEEAEEVKQKLLLLENYQSKSTVVSASIDNVDVYSIDADEKFAYVNFLKVANGSIIQSQTIEIEKRLDEDNAELLPMGILEIRQQVFSNAKEIIVPFIPDFVIPDTNYHVPQRGDKRKLLELSERNAKYHRLEKLKQKEQVDPNYRTNRILDTLRKDLSLQKRPVHIECFDNSNIQGTNPVAACVVFRDGKPSKKDYRKFNIKTVEGPNDFASMEEVVYRRYRRLLDEEQELPQLIIVDGGKGQLSSALKSLELLGLRGEIAIVGIAKRLEEIYFPGDSVPIYIDKNSESLKLIQHLRNEAHRFGITFHRDKRSKNFIKSELDDIKGIGDKTATQLLTDFKSVDRLREANEKALAESIGPAKARIVWEYFHKALE